VAEGEEVLSPAVEGFLFWCGARGGQEPVGGKEPGREPGRVDDPAANTIPASGPHMVISVTILSPASATLPSVVTGHVSRVSTGGVGLLTTTPASSPVQGQPTQNLWKRPPRGFLCGVGRPSALGRGYIQSVRPLGLGGRG